MADVPTFWYQFRRPDDEDSMAVPNLDITDSLEKIEAAAAPAIMPSATPLPSSGYKWGDRLYIQGTVSEQSSFLCLNDDDGRWGHIWMPVQDQHSPWLTVPAAAFNAALYIQHPTYPLQVTCTNQGQIQFRGAIRAVGVMSNDNDVNPLFQMPEGILPPCDMHFTCAIDPTDFDAGTTYLDYKGARMTIRDDGACILRVHGSTAVTTDVWFSQVKYFAGRNDYLVP